MISICIISLGRESIYRTLMSIFNQRINVPFEIIIILQGSIDINKIKDVSKIEIDVTRNESQKKSNNTVSVRIYDYEKNKGFGYYRNRCIDNANGDLLVWIDDDEWAINEYWLENLTSLIYQGRCNVVTSGYLVPLGYGYLSDSISLLGWPGGGAIGFEKMWKVNLDNTTSHLCSGNFAARKNIFQNIRFLESLLHGGEDNALARDLALSGEKIFYAKDATVYHQPRSFMQAISWWKTRAKSYHNSSQSSIYEEPVLAKKMRLLNNLLTFDKYFPGKIFCLSTMLSIVLLFSVQKMILLGGKKH